MHQASESAFVGKTRKNTFANTDLRETKGAESLYEGMGNLFAIFVANNKRHQNFKSLLKKRNVQPTSQSERAPEGETINNSPSVQKEKKTEEEKSRCTDGDGDAQREQLFLTQGSFSDI